MRIIIILLIFSLFLPTFAFVQGDNQVFGPPQTLEGLKTLGPRALKFLLETLKGIGQEFLGFLQKIGNWLKNIWNSYLYPFFYNIWQKTLGKEIKERKLLIEEEFKKEKEEMKREIPGVGKSLWERFKELIR